MARMSREFSLVLLGSGVLTAGYFLTREDSQLFAKEEEQARRQVGGGTHGTRHGYMPLVFLHGGGYGAGQSPPRAMAGGVARGGFGSIGAHAAGG